MMIGLGSCKYSNMYWSDEIPLVTKLLALLNNNSHVRSNVPVISPFSGSCMPRERIYSVTCLSHTWNSLYLSAYTRSLFSFVASQHLLLVYNYHRLRLPTPITTCSFICSSKVCNSFSTLHIPHHYSTSLYFDIPCFNYWCQWSGLMFSEWETTEPWLQLETVNLDRIADLFPWSQVSDQLIKTNTYLENFEHSLLCHKQIHC